MFFISDDKELIALLDIDIDVAVSFIDIYGKSSGRISILFVYEILENVFAE